MSLQEVSRPAEAEERYGEIEISETDSTYYFEDEFISTSWIPMGELFILGLENKTEHSISIIWDQSVLVTPSGTSKTLIHGEVRRIDSQRSIPPTIVASGSRTELYVGTIDGFDGEGDMPRRILIETTNTAMLERFQESTLDLIGEKVRPILALEVRGSVLEYNFTFNIDGVTHN
ncbi:MAG: hypothetical protein WD097_06435 [Balneolales bacterium]